ARIYHRLSFKSNADRIYGGCSNYCFPSAAKEPYGDYTFYQTNGDCSCFDLCFPQHTRVVMANNTDGLLLPGLPASDKTYSTSSYIT
ncbi:Unknown protein, partial [Striga hermonthica]